MNDEDFAITRGHIVSINGNAYRDIQKLEKAYQSLEEAGWFVKGTDYHSIIKHEIGHIVAKDSPGDFSLQFIQACANIIKRM